MFQKDEWNLKLYALPNCVYLFETACSFQSIASSQCYYHRYSRPTLNWNQLSCCDLKFSWKRLMGSNKSTWATLPPTCLSLHIYTRVVTATERGQWKGSDLWNSVTQVLISLPASWMKWHTCVQTDRFIENSESFHSTLWE